MDNDRHGAVALSLCPIAFQGSGLSDRTIKALVGSGILAPQLLLFMDARALKSIPRIGAKSLEEIEDYLVSLRQLAA